jgi:phage-related holin
MEEVIALFGTTKIQFIVILIAIDVILGIIAAVKKKDFKIGKLGDFLKKGVIGYILGIAVLEAFASATPSLAWLVEIAYYLAIFAMIGSILTNIAKLGFKTIPPFLQR